MVRGQTLGGGCVRPLDGQHPVTLFEFLRGVAIDRPWKRQSPQARLDSQLPDTRRAQVQFGLGMLERPPRRASESPIARREPKERASLLNWSVHGKDVEVDPPSKPALKPTSVMELSWLVLVAS